MYKIQKLNSISNRIYESFSAADYAVSDTVEAPDAIIVRSFKMDGYEPKENLVCIGRAGAGVNNIPVADMAAKGVVVFNTPGANANAVKELVIASLFLTSRAIIKGVEWAGTLTTDVAKAVEKGKSAFGGFEIAGKTLCVYGLGAIGFKVAEAAAALGMKIQSYDPFAKTDAAYLNLKATPDEAVAGADYITFHVPLLDATRGVINEALISKLNKGAKILNFSRGELANVADIKAAIAACQVSTYITDFPDEQTVNQAGIIAIPHLGASTEEAEDNCAAMAAAQIKDYLENGNIKNSVNFPAVSKEKTAKYRYSVVGKGVSLDALTPFGDAAVKTKGEFVSAVIDSDCAQLLAKIQAVAGVLKARAI
jgi:D-3-phosphoglycerate dehydrogenase